MLELASVVLVGVVLIALIMTFVRGRRGGSQAPGAEFGTLSVTGVSPRPGPSGEHYVTVTGMLSGPSVRGETVYGRFVWDAERWPSPGDQLPVSYPPGDPNRWRLGGPAS